MKLDAQGADLSILLAAGAEVLRQVDEIVMETLSDACDGLYDDQPNCSTAVDGMRSLGFLSDSRCNQSLLTAGTYYL